MTRTEINGEEPHRYSNEKFREFDNLAYLNRYQLVTGDSFEVGAAYSLHRTKEDAKSYFARWWHKTSKAIPVFISKRTLEAISSDEEGCVFSSWEN